MTNLHNIPKTHGVHFLHAQITTIRKFSHVAVIYDDIIGFETNSVVGHAMHIDLSATKLKDKQWILTWIIQHHGQPVAVFERKNVIAWNFYAELKILKRERVMCDDHDVPVKFACVPTK